jgi:hypothetical protein
VGSLRLLYSGPGETLRTSRFGLQRHVDGASVLEGVAWL